MEKEAKNEENKSHTNHLPRGYFKKRKPPDRQPRASSSNTCPSLYRDSYISLRCSISDKRHVNTNFLLCTFLLLNAAAFGRASGATSNEDLRLRRAIEEHASTTPEPANSTHAKDGICKSVDVRFDIDKIKALNDCRVVEGSVTILLMDELTDKEIADISFPDLVEITGYLMLYRISGFTSLSQLFPNLAVIRGRDLFKDYSLVVYEMIDLADLGLRNLLLIERGSVRIEKNELMCFSNSINWRTILKEGEDPYIEKNKNPAHCPNCPHDGRCPKSIDGKSSYCWNFDNCQRLCTHCQMASTKDAPRIFCSPNGTCCDPSCVGGCEDGHPKRCTACRSFANGTYPNINCLDQCPDGTFSYLKRRCLTRDQCIDLNTAQATDASVTNTDPPFIPFKGDCQKDCPAGYSKHGTGRNATCVVCRDKCLKECTVKNIIDSIETAQALKGCAVIDGPLEIQIRGTAKNPESGKNIVKELEASLSEIVTIRDYLKIARSHSILSMSFLKKLERIEGRSLEGGRNALVVWENQNLQELWDESHKLNITTGKLFFHFNPKLCFNKIEHLAKVSKPKSLPNDTIENYETAQKSNGDKTPCQVTPLNVSVAEIFPKAALLMWDPLKLDDDRSLLNYVVYYIAAPHPNVTLWEGRDACGNDGWSVEDVNDFSSTQQISQPLTKLEPYTQYAYYVKAYTLATEKKGAQSEINYFTTKPDKPEVVKRLKVTAIGPTKIHVSWETLKKVNGRLDHYILRANAIPQKPNILEQRNYCKEPIDTSQSVTAVPKELSPKELPKSPAVAPDGTCDCRTCSLKCDGKAAPQDINLEERQSANDFEDQIQDFVYVRMSNGNGGESPKESRAKRQVSLKDQEFPDAGESPAGAAAPLDRETLRNQSDFYEDNIGPEATSFVFENLNHYTIYSISIRACRKKEDSEQHVADICGPDVGAYATTWKEPANDNIPSFNVELQPNGSLTDVRVWWEPPPNPNGLLLTYTIRFRKVDVEHLQPEVRCVSQAMLNGTNQYILKNLQPGNYSIEVMATSLAGNGNYTHARYVFIKENNQWNNMWTLIAILLVVFVLVVLGLFVYFKRMYLTSISSMKLIANVNPDYAGVTYRQDEWEIPRDKIIQLQELGCGSFGMVYEGLIKDFQRAGNDVRCAIKTVNESATDKERVSFLNEASVMKQFDTHHVVRLLGVVSQGQPTLVVMELMANGDLKTYLRSHRPEYETFGTDPSPQPPTLRRILQMAIEIADGMAYLSAKKFVHRDLAARNCMVAEDMTVKIGDFGMTRDIYETDYYRKGTKGLLPVRWMSPESLKDGVFTSSSDVFSYGVVVWEMSTLAQQPYAGLSNDQVLRYVIEGGVMERPENCPDKLYELMRRCWQHRPSARPSFMEIITMLLDSVSSDFEKVSFFHSPAGVETWNQMTQGDINVLVTDDVTTPLRQGEDETSSIDGNHFLMEDVSSHKHRRSLDDDL